MTKLNLIADYRDLLASARQSYRDLVSDLKNEQHADEQFRLQMAYLQKIADTRALDLEEIFLKLRTWKEECFYSNDSLDTASIEQKIILSVIEDLAQIRLISRGSEQKVDVSEQAAA